MNYPISSQELAALQLERISCRNTIDLMEHSLRKLNTSIGPAAAQRDTIMSLLNKVQEKGRQLRVLEEMLLRQQILSKIWTEKNASQSHLMIKALDLRVHTHKTEISETREYYYRLFSEAKVA